MEQKYPTIFASATKAYSFMVLKKLHFNFEKLVRHRSYQKMEKILENNLISFKYTMTTVDKVSRVITNIIRKQCPHTGSRTIIK